MRHLKTYRQIFEYKLESTLNDTIWTFLTGMVTFHDLYVYHNEAWVGIITLTDWEDLEGEQKSITKNKYKDYTREYESVENTQKNFNFFVAYINGAGDWYDYDENNMVEKPIEWYMKEFGQDRTTASLMKAIADESEDPLKDLDLGFTNI